MSKRTIVSIDAEVIDKCDLHPLAGWLFVVILRHLNRADNNAFPSVARLATLANMSKASVIRYTKELEEKNLIVVQREKTSIVQSVNHYQLPAASMVSHSNHSGISQQPVVSDSNHKTTPEQSVMVSDSNTNYKDKDKRKKQDRAREVSDLDDVPKHERLEICKAWADSLGAHPIGAYSENNQRVAAEIWRAGYRASQVALFVKNKKADGWWKGKTLTLAKVAELMPEWLVDHAKSSERQLPPEVIHRPNIEPVEWGTDFFVRKPVSAVQHD